MVFTTLLLRSSFFLLLALSLLARLRLLACLRLLLRLVACCISRGLLAVEQHHHVANNIHHQQIFHQQHGTTHQRNIHDNCKLASNYHPSRNQVTKTAAKFETLHRTPFLGITHLCIWVLVHLYNFTSSADYHYQSLTASYQTIDSEPSKAFGRPDKITQIVLNNTK